MDIFDEKSISPMLIGASGSPFDSSDYIFELKMDGERCLAYLNSEKTELRNKRNDKMLPKVPELSSLHKQVTGKCILDGELIVFKDGKSDFFEIQRRSLMSNNYKIQLAAGKLPASFVAFDILYSAGEQLTSLPLMERKKILSDVIKENDRLALSRYIENNGKVFFELTEKQGLEGIVAKQKFSKYYFGKRTSEWIKIKNLIDDDFVVCGYIIKEKGVTSIVLGQYDEAHKLIYKGHVTLGISNRDFNIIQNHAKADKPDFPVPSGNQNAVWLEPSLVCTVKYMMQTQAGSLRHAVFKGLRTDKSAEECTQSN